MDVEYISFPWKRPGTRRAQNEKYPLDDNRVRTEYCALTGPANQSGVMEDEPSRIRPQLCRSATAAAAAAWELKCRHDLIRRQRYTLHLRQKQTWRPGDELAKTHSLYVVTE